MCKCAHHFNISRFILQDRWNGKALKFIRKSIYKRLATVQERAIKDFIIRINEKNISLTFRLVENVINYMFREADSNAASVEVL